MSRLAAGLILAITFCTTAQAADLSLGNEPWPPFVIEGKEQGTAEAIVCEALERAGHECSVIYDSWESTLTAAAEGKLDGVAAIWFTPQRGQDLLFSAPYLTNRLVPVTAVGGPTVRQLSDLEGRKVALEVAVAYGEELIAAQQQFETVPVRGSDAALQALREQRAEVAVVDELFARELVDSDDGRGLVIGDVALAYRELHFAMSRQNPMAQQVIASFNQEYRMMLRDGSVNRILDMEWLATDLGDDGVMDFIHRGDLGLAISEAAAEGDSVYALGQEEHEAIRDPGFVGSNANYLADDQVYQTPEAAMKALEPGKRCSYDSLQARIVCTGR